MTEKFALEGCDIFMTRNNGEGICNQKNIGMPYNSPYDDYMLAIDEGVGHRMVGHRPQPPGRLDHHLQVCIPREMRVRLPPPIPQDSPDWL